MKIIQCEKCGSSEFYEKSGFRICKYCNTTYQIFAEDMPNTNITSLELDDDVQRLLDKCKKEPWNAKKYANLILDIDATNTEAMRYLK